MLDGSPSKASAAEGRRSPRPRRARLCSPGAGAKSSRGEWHSAPDPSERPPGAGPRDRDLVATERAAQVTPGGRQRSENRAPTSSQTGGAPSLRFGVTAKQRERVRRARAREWRWALWLPAREARWALWLPAREAGGRGRGRSWALRETYPFNSFRVSSSHDVIASSSFRSAAFSASDASVAAFFMLRIAAAEPTRV